MKFYKMQHKMGIFSNEEKNELLKRIAGANNIYEAYSDREIAMIDDELYPNGLVDVLSKLTMPDHYICEISKKGLAFLEKGGYEIIQREQEEKEQIENERRELTRLQAEELNYKKRIRKLERTVLIQHFIEAVLFLISVILTVVYFCLKTNP